MGNRVPGQSVEGEAVALALQLQGQHRSFTTFMTWVCHQRCLPGAGPSDPGAQARYSCIHRRVEMEDGPSRPHHLLGTVGVGEAQAVAPVTPLLFSSSWLIPPPHMGPCPQPKARVRSGGGVPAWLLLCQPPNFVLSQNEWLQHNQPTPANLASHAEGLLGYFFIEVQNIYQKGMRDLYYPHSEMN